MMVTDITTCSEFTKKPKQKLHAARFSSDITCKKAMIARYVATLTVKVNNGKCLCLDPQNIHLSAFLRSIDEGHNAHVHTNCSQFLPSFQQSKNLK